MTAFHWFLPTTGDGRTLVGGGHGVPGGLGHPGGRAGTANAFRPPSIDYLAQVARTAELLDYEGVLTPTGTWCEDAWLTTAALVRETSRLKFLVAFRPGSIEPTLAAQMAATYQRLSNGRLLLNVVTGGEPAEQARFGDRLTQEQRYARTDEFLTVVRGAWDGGFDFTGEYYDVRDARTREAPDPLPELYFGGSSPAAGPVAAKHVDVYLTAVVAQAQDTLGASLSVGQQRMRALHEGRRDARDAHDLEVAPGLWAGVGLVRGGAGTALVGSHREVAELVEQYRAIGIEEFVLSGYPHVEEAYWFAEGVRPLLG